MSLFIIDEIIKHLNIHWMYLIQSCFYNIAANAMMVSNSIIKLFFKS